MSVIHAQILFYENFEGVLNNTTKLPENWQENGKSLDGFFSVGDSIQANYILSQTSLWKVPSHTKFVMTNDVRCSYEKGIGYCDKSRDRLILPKISIPNFSGSLILKFDAFFTGKLGSLATVEISIDGGVSWVKEYDLLTNETNWTLNSVNLSKYKGISNLLVSFLYNDNNLVRDGLAIDNVELKKQIPWKDASLDFVDAAKYSIIPLPQVDSIPLGMTFHNNGSLTLDSVQLHLEIIEQASNQKLVYSNAKTYLKVNLTDTVSYFFGKFLPSKKNTTYIIKHWLSVAKDTVKQNDTIIIPVYIAQACYARDNGKETSSFDLTSANTLTIGNVFSFKNPSYIDSVYFESNSATNGTSVQAYVFPLVDGKVSLVSIAKSEVYTLTSGANSKFLILKGNVSDKILLDTGNYLIAIQKTNGGGSMGIKLCDNYFQKNTVFMRIGEVAFQTLDSYFSGAKKSVPVIRAYTSPYCKLASKIDQINTKCKFATGELKAKPINAKYPVTYLWSTGSKDSILTKLPVGNYALRIIDYYNCVFDSTNIILKPFLNPIIEIDSLSHPLCYNQPSGYISIKTDNSNNVSKVKWNDSYTNQLFYKNAKSGEYTIKVIDGNNCEDSIKVTLTNPDSLSVDYLVKDESIKSKGIISLIVAGGNPPYSYNWGDTIYDKSRVELKGDSTYSVVVTDTNGCKKTTKIYVGSTVGMEEDVVNAIKIYPNPVTDMLYVELENMDVKEMKVLDMSGKSCMQFDFTQNLEQKYSVDVSKLENGVYFLYLKKNGIIHPVKFFKN